jgi:uncharacterized hydantoinase/oxoprolinase family protein
MSITVYWEPVRRAKSSISDNLKRVLQKRYESLAGVTMSTRDLMYLYGLRDAGIDEANKLITAIQKHTEIEFTEDY